MKLGKTMKMIALVMSFSVFFTTTAVANTTVDWKVKAQQKADILTSAYHETSVQYAVIEKGRILTSGHSGEFSKTDSRPITADTMYGIGSISKMFVTVLAMDLVDEGKLDLEEPIVTYIPEFEMADERYSKITTRMLLNHSSGLMGSTFDVYFNYADTNANAQLLEDLKTQRLKADPGAFSVYCNDGFTLAEIVIERVTGKKFTAVLHERIMAPLEMKNTKTPFDQLNPSAIAKTYFSNSNTALPLENLTSVGAGGMYSSAEDLCRFSTIFTGNDIIEEQSVKDTFEKEFAKGIWPDENDDNIIGYGLGWDSVNLYPFSDYNIQAVAKGGDTLFYHGSLVVLPEHDMAAVVLSSGGNSTYNQMFASDILMSILDSRGIIDEKTEGKTFQTVTTSLQLPEGIKEFEGFYGFPNGIQTVFFEENDLVLAIPGYKRSTKQVIKHIGDGKFTTEDGTIEISFEKASNGNIYLKQRTYAQIPPFGNYAISQYILQQLVPQEIEKDIQSAWDKRIEGRYFVLDKSVYSASYLMSPSARFITHSELPGFVVSNKIENDTLATTYTQIPGLSGRDMFDYSIQTIADGKEIAVLNNYHYIHESDIDVLYDGKTSQASIGEDGFAKWYTVPESMDKSEVKIRVLQGKGAFAIYGKAGNLTYFSWLGIKMRAMLEDGGYIVLIGDAGTKFEIGRVNVK